MPRVPTAAAVATLALVLASGTAGYAQQTTTTMTTTRGTASATRTLSLDDALRIAQLESPAVGIARAGVTRTTGQLFQSRSQALPQISGTGGYTRTLASQFQGLSFGGGTPDTSAQTSTALCSPNIPANATTAQRNAALAEAASCQSSAGGLNFASVGLGAANEWSLGLNFSQTLYSGGKVQGQNQAAEAQQRSAGIEVTAQRAQAALDAAQAYYDASLADRLVIIADSSLAETDEVLRLAKLGHQVGEQSDFDLLKAQVTHDNQVPVLIQARTNRRQAYLRLKQQLNLPLDDSLTLTTSLDDGAPAAAAAGNAPAADTLVEDRAAVREGEESVRAGQGQLQATLAENRPSLAVVSGYQRLYFPNAVLPSLAQGKNNWTIGVSTNFNVFTGGRTHGDELVARATVDQSQAQLKQTRLLAELDARTALDDLTQAQAAWTAVQGTVDQAQRAYNIDQIRFREGISTQTDLAQSRLLLEQSMANRAQSARDLAVARIRLSLLRDLPIQSAGAGATSGTNGSSQSTGSGSQSTTLAPTSASQSPSTQSPIGGVPGVPGSGGSGSF